MSRFLLALLLLLGGEGAALACSCMMTPTDPAVRAALAREVARDAIALVEVELVAPYDERRGRGEQLRIRRTLAGGARPSFEVERPYTPSSASCDVEFQRGRRTILVLYPPRTGARPPAIRYRISSSCSAPMLTNAGFRDAVAAAIRLRRRF
ncbi:MAG TPA: hypothetical protein VEX35_03155 [Allosphingosinicella sp.]|nr:hypothetical protein [Allosphingosinicella sp.]